MTCHLGKIGKRERFQDIAVYLTSKAATIEPFDWQELRGEAAIICDFQSVNLRF